MTDPEFFPFHPRRLRLALAFGALACTIVTAWALSGAVAHTERLGWARAGISAGLACALAISFGRLRPRPGWGVRVTTLSLVIARTFSAQERVIPWARVVSVQRAGKRKESLLVLLDSQERYLVPQALFPSRAAFEALAGAVEARAPARFDA